ncbi:histone H1.10 [Conger conger]|uniref:histone H1.10 n=1 Tax=Conger conger TaxID=82655 RepID=UPI002A5A5C73|nr:histone H1.10 [Conger conger]
MATDVQETVPVATEEAPAAATKKKATVSKKAKPAAAPATTAAKKKKNKKKKNHPGRYSQLLIDTIRKLGERNGSSLARIFNECKKEGWFDQLHGRTYLRYSIKALLLNDSLIQVRGSGANGSFRLNKKKFEKQAPKKTTPKPAKSSATPTKKTKKTPVKKAKAKVSPKKKPAKPTAASKKIAKPKKAAKKPVKKVKKPKKISKPTVPKVPKTKSARTSRGRK